MIYFLKDKTTYWFRLLGLFLISYRLLRLRLQYVDYSIENHKLITKFVKDSVDHTPYWFKKYKERIIYHSSKKELPQ